jgi:hypothetical protein
LNSQLLAVVIESDLARTFKGKISPVTTHAHGPQEQAKKKMLFTGSAYCLWVGKMFHGQYSLDAHKGDQGLLGSQVINASNSARNGNNELADAHANCAEEQEWATTPGFNQVQSWER